MEDDRNLALEYRIRKQREDQTREIIREIEERAKARRPHLSPVPNEGIAP